MKKKLFLLIAACMAIVQTALAYDFSVVVPSGQTLYFNLLSDTTVEVTSGDTYPTGDLTIPATVTFNNVTYSVTSIGYLAFNDCSGLTSLIIPNSVTSIGDRAFAFCEQLTSVSIPNSVTSIGTGAFFGCYVMTLDSIPSSVISIGHWAFSRCFGLISVTIPNSVTSIGSWAFADCVELTSITISNSVTSIGENVCCGCGNLASIVVESGNTHYDSRDNCNAIIQTDSNLLIQGCKNTIIPNSVTGIGDYAFNGCIGLTSITIPNTVTSIGTSPFCQCNNLTSIVVESGNTHYDSREKCNAIIQTDNNLLVQGCNSTIIPNSVTSIKDRAFNGCSGLTLVTIPNSVTSIGYSAFFGCTGLTSLTISSSETSIEQEAFAACYNMTAIHSLDSEPPTLADNVFQYVNTSIPVYVPCGAITDYQTANGWSIFTNIQGKYSYTVTLGDSYHGSVDIVQRTCENDTATLTATADEDFYFDHWSDGSIENPHTITVTSDTTLSAFFMKLVHDTVRISNNYYQYDTTIVNIFDTVIHYDTTIVNIYDTVINNYYQYDTTLVNIFDTTILNYYSYDTTVVNNQYFDTVFVTNYYHDTVIVNNYIYDTIYLNRYIFDTVYIHDTVFVDPTGIDGIETVDAKIYQRDGRIVVESGDGGPLSEVRVFDVMGRCLAQSHPALSGHPSQGEGTGWRTTFEVPASGTYMIKIGNYPARKVVVIR